MFVRILYFRPVEVGVSGDGVAVGRRPACLGRPNGTLGLFVARPHRACALGAGYYIQSAYHMDDDIKKEQEIRPFLKLNDGFRKLVITGDDVPCHVNSMGITVMNVIDFMKNPFSLERI